MTPVDLFGVMRAGGLGDGAARSLLPEAQPWMGNYWHRGGRGVSLYSRRLSILSLDALCDRGSP